MIKRTFKAIGMLLIFGVSLASLYIVNLFFMKPASIDHFLGKEFLIGLADSPESMTYIGIFDQFNWITKHNSNLSIPNPDDLQADIRDARKTLKMLNKYKLTLFIDKVFYFSELLNDFFLCVRWR